MVIKVAGLEAKERKEVTMNNGWIICLGIVVHELNDFSEDK